MLCKGQTRVGNELTSPEFCLPFAHLPNGKQPNSLAVYHLHGQTGRIKVWAMANEIQDWYTKFPSGLAFIICTNQSHLPKKRPRKPETNIKEGLKKWNANFRLEHSDRENRTIFSDVPFLSEIFHWNDPKSRIPFTFQPDFPETFCKWSGAHIGLLKW